MEFKHWESQIGNYFRLVTWTSTAILVNGSKCVEDTCGVSIGILGPCAMPVHMVSVERRAYDYEIEILGGIALDCL